MADGTNKRSAALRIAHGRFALARDNSCEGCGGKREPRQPATRL